jgi:ribosomal protein S17E
METIIQNDDDDNDVDSCLQPCTTIKSKRLRNDVARKSQEVHKYSDTKVI